MSVLLAILSIFFPILALIGAVYFFLSGEAGLAIFFFIWWLIWDN